MPTAPPKWQALSFRTLSSTSPPLREEADHRPKVFKLYHQKIFSAIKKLGAIYVEIFLLRKLNSVVNARTQPQDRNLTALQ